MHSEILLHSVRMAIYQKKKKLTGKEEYEEKLDYLYAVCGNAASKENSMKATPNIKNRKKKKKNRTSI